MFNDEKTYIICIMGRTSAGKDSLAEQLANLYGITNIISYTTRPRRDGESKLKHIFISEECYDFIYREKKKLAYTEINGNRYFTLWDQIDRKLIADKVSGVFTYVIDPIGVQDIRERLKTRDDVEIITIYVYCDREERKRRYNNREQKVTIPFEDRDEAESKQQFDDFEQNHLLECDYILNTSRGLLLEELNSIIRSRTRPGIS